MRNLTCRVAVLFFVCAIISGSMWAQEIKFPAASQKASIFQTVGLTDVTIVYHRPGVKGRTIWGDLVPYNKIWRTGANNATTIEFSTDVTIEGQKLAAGKYGLYTIPGQEEWVFIFSKNSSLWGDDGYKEEEDALRVKVKPMAVPHLCEWMTFGITDLTEYSAQIYLQWEKLVVGFKMEADTKGLILASVDKAMAGLSNTPFRAAQFAFKTEMMDKAKSWIDTSVNLKAGYSNLLLQAKIYQKLAKTPQENKNIIKILERAISLIPELPENYRPYATEAGKMLEELKTKK